MTLDLAIILFSKEFCRVRSTHRKGDSCSKITLRSNYTRVRFTHPTHLFTLSFFLFTLSSIL
jgi:hypothetical protein